MSKPYQVTGLVAGHLVLVQAEGRGLLRRYGPAGRSSRSELITLRGEPMRPPSSSPRYVAAGVVVWVGVMAAVVVAAAASACREPCPRK